ncbi:MAG: hypothetical protein ABIP12_02720 [Terriglobales bacterium]
MKNQKTLSGVAYMFLGAALLVGGASLQEQMERLAADPELQVAKAMYVSMFNRTVSAKTEFLAENRATVPMQFAYATARVAEPVVAKRVNVAVASQEVIGVVTPEVIDVVTPEVMNVEVQLAELPTKLAPVRPSRVKMQLLKVQTRMAALQSLPKPFQFTNFAPAVPAPPTPGFSFATERAVVVNTSTPKAAACENTVSAEAETKL